jgi:hypothetical protein
MLGGLLGGLLGGGMSQPQQRGYNQPDNNPFDDLWAGCSAVAVTIRRRIGIGSSLKRRAVESTKS